MESDNLTFTSILCMVMYPFIFLLTHYMPKHSFCINLESD